MPDWVIPTLTIIIGPGGLLAGWLLYRREDKKAPIERVDAQVAHAIAMSTTASAMYQTVTTRLAVQDAKVDAQDAKIDRWTDWYFDLRTGWLVHRLRETAPPPPQ